MFSLQELNTTMAVYTAQQNQTSIYMLGLMGAVGNATFTAVCGGSAEEITKAFGASLANVVLLSVLTVYSVVSGNEQKLMTYVSLLSTALLGLCVTYGAYGEVTVSGDKGSKTISTEDVSKSSTGKNTYYHVTTREAAESIKKSGELKHGKYEAAVFAWNQQPTRDQARAGGLGSRNEVVLQFDTSASFVQDEGVDLQLRPYACKSLLGSVTAENITEVGFRKE